MLGTQRGRSRRLPTPPTPREVVNLHSNCSSYKGPDVTRHHPHQERAARCLHFSVSRGVRGKFLNGEISCAHADFELRPGRPRCYYTLLTITRGPSQDLNLSHFHFLSRFHLPLRGAQNTEKEREKKEGGVIKTVLERPCGWTVIHKGEISNLRPVCSDEPVRVDPALVPTHLQ